MRILVVYYSRTSVTKTAAQTISKTIGADLEQINDLQNREGILGYIGAGYGVLFDRLTKLGELKCKPEDYDLVIVGTPVWAGKPSIAVTTFLKKYGGKIRHIAVFAIHATHNPYPKVFDFIEKIVNKKSVKNLSLSANSARQLDFEKIIRYATDLNNFKPDNIQGI